MNSKYLVSIIIPAFNAEKYIEQCVLSVVRQTYKNLEIIIVNDGSTDSTASILEVLESTDERITVINSKNAGVSVARNTGIESSKGDYLVFIDADDYIADDYVEYMLGLAEKTDAPFCLSKNCYTKRGEAQVANDNIISLSAVDATALLLSPRVIVGCWNKIFKRSFIAENNMRFSDTLFYGEGLTFITNAAQLCDSVGVGERKVYYYRRNNELSATTKFNIEKIYNGEKALLSIGENLKIKNQKTDTMLKLHLSIFYLGALVRLRSNNLKKAYLQDYKRWLKTVRKNTVCISFSSEVSVYRKLLLIGGSISPWLMMKLDNLRRKKIVDNSVN